MIFMGLLLFSSAALNFIGIFESEKPPIIAISLGTLFLFFIPISVYYSARKNYFTHSRLQENITYEITDEEITIKGDSFNTNMTWDKTHKVLELRSWLLIYENKMLANIIPKSSINNIEELRQIIRKQNIKQKIKRS